MPKASTSSGGEPSQGKAAEGDASIKKGGALSSSSSSGEPNAAAPRKKAPAKASAKAARDEEEDSSSDSSDSDGEGGIPLGPRESDDEVDDESSSSEEEAPKKGKGKKKRDLEVTFEFIDPSEAYQGSLRGLLRTFPLSCNLTSLADAICDQKRIGTLVIQSEMTDIFALITAINIGHYREEAFMKEMLTSLRGKCTDPASLRHLERLISGDLAGSTGLLLRAAMVNLPPDLVPTLHESLLSDISWAGESAEDDEDESTSNFERFLFMAPFKELSLGEQSSLGASEPPSNPKKKAKAASSASSAAPPVPSSAMFDRFDDEVISQAVEWSFTFDSGSGKKVLVGVISLDGYQQAVNRIKALVSGSR